jgi:hypothetical protein
MKSGQNCSIAVLAGLYLKGSENAFSKTGNESSECYTPASASHRAAEIIQGSAINNDKWLLLKRQPPSLLTRFPCSGYSCTEHR